VLCEECRDELSSPIRVSPEQIQVRAVRPTTAALIDLWGRAHQLDARTLVGRQIENQGIAVLEPSVSRHHAHLTLDGTVWTLRDLGSANGTYHDDRLVEQPVVVHGGDRVRFGQIAFYMIEDVAVLPAPRSSRTVTTTLRPFDLQIPPPPPVATAAVDDDRAADFAEEEEPTNVGLPELRFPMNRTGSMGSRVPPALTSTLTPAMS